MIVMVDGPDNAGKTTLARELEARGFRYLHFSVPPPGVNLFALYAKVIAEAAMQPEDTVIDRLHLAEWAYGRVIRGDSRVSAAQLVTLNRLLFGCGGYLVLCEAPEDTVLGLWRARLEMEYVKDEALIRAIMREYRLLTALSATSAVDNQGRLVSYDFTKHIGEAGGFAGRLIAAGRADAEKV